VYWADADIVARRSPPVLLLNFCPQARLNIDGVLIRKRLLNKLDDAVLSRGCLIGTLRTGLSPLESFKNRSLSKVIITPMNRVDGQGNS
jgi:hypothetical protein